MSHQVEFADFTAEEHNAVAIIVARAATIAEMHSSPLDRQSLMMDLAAVHVHTPLRLVELAHTDDFNLVHDAFGIRANIDRETGKLRNHFLPRFAC